MHLVDRTWEDIAGAETELAVLPVGSTEQHGPHAPLGTDAMTAEAVAAAGAEAYPGEVIVGPTIPVGISEEHRQFPGTMWVSEDTFRQYVREAAVSLSTHGFDRIVFVNGHGGNTAALRELAGTITRHEDVYAVPFTWFESVDLEETAGVRMGHAGPAETALIRHTRPEAIDQEQLTAAAEGASDGWGDWTCYVNLAYDSAEFTDNGVVGDPTQTDAEDGAALRAAAGDALAEVLEAVATRDVTRPAAKDRTARLDETDE